MACDAWRVARGAWRVARGAWRVMRGASLGQFSIAISLNVYNLILIQFYSVQGRHFWFTNYGIFLLHAQVTFLGDV